MNKKIFIGGTGRSGTTVVSKYLGSHSDISRLPREMRFIVDEGGLINLHDSLTRNFSIDQSRMALKKFHSLMYEHLLNKRSTPYLSYDFSSLFEPDVYFGELESFFNKTSNGTFVGNNLHSVDKNPAISEFFRTYLNWLNRIYRKGTLMAFDKANSLPIFSRPNEEMFLAKFFGNENELNTHISNLINNIFSSFCKKDNTVHWCEDTPANILHVEQLSRIMPDAYFIHVVRNPFGVVNSLRNQSWAPNNIEQLVLFVSNIYEKLISISSKYGSTSVNFLEVRLEDVAIDMGNSLHKIQDFVGIEDKFDGSIKFRKDRVDNYQQKFSKKEYDYIGKKLSKYIDFYEYNG